MFHLRVDGFIVPVNVPDRNYLLTEVGDRLRRGEGFAVATVNLDHVVKLRAMPEFRAAYSRQDLVTADGHPIVWLSRLTGERVSLVTGSDLVDPLVGVAAAAGAPVAFLGATEETLDQAAGTLEQRHPGLRVVARLAPGQGFDPHGAEADALIEALRRSGARLVFLALGAPKQELFAARCRELLPDLGFVSVGAGLDFIAARQRRAPAWMQRLALEWLWRMASNPRRLGARYLACAMSLPALAAEALLSTPAADAIPGGAAALPLPLDGLPGA